MCYNGLMNNEHGWIAAALSKNTQINSKGDGCMKFIISGFSKPIKKFFIIKKLEKQYKIKDKLHFIV